MNEMYDESTSKIEFSKESACLLLRQKLLFSSNDHFSIMLLGSSNSEDHERPNISYVKSMDIPEIQTFNTIREIQAESDNKGDCKKNSKIINFIKILKTNDLNSVKRY